MGVRGPRRGGTKQTVKSCRIPKMRDSHPYGNYTGETLDAWGLFFRESYTKRTTK